MLITAHALISENVHDSMYLGVHDGGGKGGSKSVKKLSTWYMVPKRISRNTLNYISSVNYPTVFNSVKFMN